MKTVKALVSQQGLSSLQRPRFSAGLLLEDEDLTAGVDYTRNMMRLMFSSLFGCGVICGLKVEAALTCNRSQVKVTVNKGLALDCMGDPIQVPKGLTVVYDPDCKPLPDWIWVAVCYFEKCCRPKDISCSPDDDSHVVHTRAYDGFEIKLYGQRPECACSCEPETRPEEQPQECCESETGGTAPTGAPTGAAAAPTTVATGQTPPGQPQEKPKEKVNCACYDDHNNGICACDCGCNCVVIAKIHIPELRDEKESGGDADEANKKAVDDSMRRLIRPVLIGYLPCLPKAEGGAETPPQGE